MTDAGMTLSGGTPPEGAPPEGAPPEGAPPEGAPPEGAPPEGAPPEGAPPGGAPPGGAPPGGAPPGGAPPGDAPPGDAFPLDLFLDDNQCSYPDEAPAFEIPRVPGDGYALEVRAETINVVTLGNSVRRGELDMVQIGAAAVTDMVAGTETATIEGKLREHTGSNLAYKSSRMETTVDGRMSITAGMEDGIILGGAMTDTWNGGTFILAAMSDDMCIGAGARVTAPVDLWLNTLTGMEERPGTATADGILVEAYGTLFEREYGPSLHAAGLAVFNGVTVQTQKTGFRPLMHVATGVRNLIPGAGGAAGEPAPPSPPATPTAAGGAAAGVGLVTFGASAARVTAGLGLGADSMSDMFRAGDTATDVQNAADLRHAAGTAAQVEDLRSAAANPQIPGDLHRTNYDQFSMPAEAANNPQGLYSTVHTDDADPYAVVPLPTSGRPDLDAPPAGALDPYAVVPLPTSGRLDLDAPLPGALDPYAPPFPPARTPESRALKPGMDEALRQEKMVLGVGWGKEAEALYKQAADFEQAANNPGPAEMMRADALKEAGSRLQIAWREVASGRDPRIGLGYAAEALEAAGYAAEAGKLRKAAEEFTEFLDRVRTFTVDGEYPHGVMDFSENLGGAGAGNSPYHPSHVLDSEADLAPPPATGPAPTDGSLAPNVDRAGAIARLEQEIALQRQEVGRLAEMKSEDLGRAQAELEARELSRDELAAGRDPRDALRSRRDELATQYGAVDPRVRAYDDTVSYFTGAGAFAEVDVNTGRIPEFVDTSRILADWRQHLGDLQALGEDVRPHSRAEIERAEAFEDVNGFVQQAIVEVSARRDPRPELVRHAVDLERQLYVDGGTGAGEASVLRAMEKEYTLLVQEASQARKLDGLQQRVDAFADSFDVVGGPVGMLHTSTPLLSGAPPPALLDAASPSFPGGQGALDPQPGGHGSGDYDHLAARIDGAAADSTGAVRRQGDPPPQQPVRLEIPALQRLDAEGDDGRRLLDVEPVQVVDAGEDATSVARLDVDPGTGTEGGRAGTGVEGINPAGRPEFSDSGAHWQVEVPGSGRLDPDTGASAVLGDYAEVVHHGDSAVDGVSGGQGTVHAAPPDTQAAVDAMPDTSRVTGGDYQTISESRRKLAEGNALMIQLNSEYMEHQLDLNWPAMLAYGEALNDLRDDIFEVLVEFPKYTDAANGPKPKAQTAYVMLVAEVVKASQNAVAAGDMGDMAAVQRLTKFLDGFRQRMEDTLTNLGGRADEFEAVKTHSAFSLDPHIDQQKLAQWLDEREEDAARRMVEAVMAGDVDAQKAASQEMSYYQQMALDLKQGRNPLTESGYQVEYLRLTGQTEQADAYLGLHDTLAETMSDPSFHKTAAEMGEATYAPVHFTRPDLGTAPTLEDTAVPAAVDNVDTDVLSAEVREPGGASRGADGAQLDAGDYAANRDAINEQAGQGDYVHAPQDQPSGLSDDDYDHLGALIDDDYDHLGALRDDDYDHLDALIDTAKTNAGEIQPGYVQTYMDTAAQVRGDAFKQQFMADNPGGFLKATTRARVDAANQMWGQMPMVDQRPLTEWDYRPSGTRSWKSSEQPGGKSVRFGDAKQITYAADSGLDTSQTVRQVPTPNAWRTRRPLTGSPGSPPVSRASVALRRFPESFRSARGRRF